MKISSVAITSLVALAVSPTAGAFSVIASLSSFNTVTNKNHVVMHSSSSNKQDQQQGDDGSAKRPTLRSSASYSYRKGGRGPNTTNKQNYTKRHNHKKHNNKKKTNQNNNTSGNNNIHVIPNPDEQPIQQTLSGGQALILAMARGMMVWDSPPSSSSSEGQSSNDLQQDPSSSSSSSLQSQRPNVLPRWHPHGGISDVNPSFRTAPPVMNNQGYAGIIWRNVRKRNKPTLWRHALRMYEKMKVLEEEGTKSPGSGAASALKIKRSNIHYEGALQACAKLGLWREALGIYKEVVENERSDKSSSSLSFSGMDTPMPSSSLSTDAVVARQRRRVPQVSVTDNMMLSCMYACVRASKDMNPTESTLAERRLPLDAARAIILQIETRHNLPLVARHLNPLAAAYQTLGLVSDASDLLTQNLADRTSGSEPEDGHDVLNVNDICAKDKASYALLVKGAVLQGDFSEAVDALTDMTEAGLYPNERNLNAWTEVSERKSKQRNTRGRKKKRDEYWLERVR